MQFLLTKCVLAFTLFTVGSGINPAKTNNRKKSYDENDKTSKAGALRVSA
jgi:hypothetical protein